MNVSTAYLFDRATDRMSTLQNKLATTQAQLATAKQVLSPSDAPDQAAAIQRLKGEIQRQESHVNTMEVALRRYSAEETALKSSSDILVRLKELALQAANDTYSPSDRKAISVEMEALRNQLLSLGNSRDDGGNYLFSGTRVSTPPFAEDANGRVMYMGDQTRTRIPAGVERDVAYTRSGTDVMARVIRADDGSSMGFFDAIDALIEDTIDGDTSGISTGLDSLDQMISNLTYALAEVGADQNVVQSQLDVLGETALRLKSTLSNIEDLDYAEAVTRMNKEMMAMEAAMGSFAKISGLSLFDYIRG
jgi:flagellar hook-associated protein 3 FlgL